MLFCFTPKNNFCKLSALKCFDRIRSKFLQFNKTCFIVKSSLQFIHCGALSLFKRCKCENLQCPIRHLVKTSC